MSTDFRPIGTRTLAATPTQNLLAGLRAIRAGAGMTYKFGRDAETQLALGTVDEAAGVFTALGEYNQSLLNVATGHVALAEGANVTASLLDTVTGHAAAAEGVHNVSIGGSEPLGVDYETAVAGGGVSADTNRDVISGPSTGDGQNRVFHYGSALAYEETGIYVYGGAAGTDLIDPGDYEVDGDDVIFDTAPALNDIIHIYRKALGTPVYTLAAAPVTPAGSTAVQVLVMKTNTPETLTVTTDYVVSGGGLTVTLTAAGIDKAVTGKTISFFYKATNDKFPVTGDALNRLGCTANGVFGVTKEGVGVSADDYTVYPSGPTAEATHIVFDADKVPVVGNGTNQTIAIFRTFTNNVWKMTAVPPSHVGWSLSQLAKPVVKVDGGAALTDGTEFDYSSSNLTVTFKPGNIPTAAQVITVQDIWQNDKWLLTGGVTQPAGHSAPGVLGVYNDVANGAPTSLVDPSDYTLVAGVSVVFDTPPAAGRYVKVVQALVHDVFTATSNVPAADSHNSAVPLIYVEVDAAEQTLDTDYTVGAGASAKVVTFDAAHIPATGTEVTLFWRRLNDKYAHSGGESSADQTISVLVDDTPETNIVVTGPSVVFDAGFIPTVGQEIDFSIVGAAAAVVIAGGEVWLDTHRVNVPAWDYILLDAQKVVEIM